MNTDMPNDETKPVTGSRAPHKAEPPALFEPLAADDRLLSREIDGALTPAEHAELQMRRAADAALAAESGRWQALDALAGETLRAAARPPAGRLGSAYSGLPTWIQTSGLSGRSRRWLRRLQPLIAAAAVALCALLWRGQWTTPQAGNSGAANTTGATAQTADLLTWRTPAAPDAAANIDPTLLDRPHAAWRETDRSWIVIPAEDSDGAMYVVQIDRVREQSTAVQADF